MRCRRPTGCSVGLFRPKQVEEIRTLVFQHEIKKRSTKPSRRQSCAELFLELNHGQHLTVSCSATIVASSSTTIKAKWSASFCCLKSIEAPAAPSTESVWPIVIPARRSACYQRADAATQGNSTLRTRCVTEVTRRGRSAQAG